MTKLDAIERVMLDNGGTASWNIIYDNITKYYPSAKSSAKWKEGIRGTLLRITKQYSVQENWFRDLCGGRLSRRNQAIKQ